MEKELKKITAEEARRIADDSYATLNHIYKFIKEEAKENRTVLYYGGLAELSKKMTLFIEETLIADGYAIEETDEGRTLKISW